MFNLLDKIIVLFTNLYVYTRYAKFVKRFRSAVGYFPNVAMPGRYSEKMLWRKIFDRNPLFSIYCDKLSSKGYIQQRCPRLATANLRWSGTDTDTIRSESLSKPTVLKVNFGCGRNLHLKANADPASISKPLVNKWLSRPHGIHMLEWGYQTVTGKLFLEDSIVTQADQVLHDLCVHTFSGEPVLLEAVLHPRTENQQKAYFTIDGTRQRELEKQGDEPGGRLLPLDYQLPPEYTEAVAAARILGKGTDYARYDFMISNKTVYGGEITVYPGSGLQNHSAFETYNAFMTQKWDIRDSWFLQTRHTALKNIYANTLNRILNNADNATAQDRTENLI